MQTFETNFRQEKEHMKTEPGQSIDSSNRSDWANYLNGKMCSCRNAGKMLPVGVEVMPQQTRTHTHRHTHTNTTCCGLVRESLPSTALLNLHLR
jgi:hypothetical protein